MLLNRSKILLFGFKSLILLIITIFTPLFINAQFKLENWRTYTSMNNVVNTILDSKGRIWVGTSGGVFVYDPSNGTYKEFRNINGLLSTEITAINYNEQDKKVYIGSIDGVIDICTEDFEWTHITDIKKPKFTNPQIYDIVFRDSLAYIAGGFGFTVFDCKRQIFIETPPFLNEFQPNTPVYQILIKADEIWLATEAGIAYAKIKSTLGNPYSWTNLTQKNGLADKKVYSIAYFNDTIYAANAYKIFKLDSNTFLPVLTLDSYHIVNRFVVFRNDLYYSTQYMVGSLTKAFNIDCYKNQINGFSFLDINRILLYYKEKGLSLIVNNQESNITPETPASNLFLSLCIDNLGNLWSATDKNGRGRGFTGLINGKWKNFTREEIPEIVDNQYYKVRSSNDGRIALSNWGKGFLITNNTETDKFYFYNNLNSPLKGIEEDTNWVVTGETAFDRYGNLWIVNFGNQSNGPLLVVLDKNNKFYSFPNPVSPLNRYFINLAIDYNGTKWVGSNYLGGVLYFNERNTFDDKVDDIYGVFQMSNSQLPSNETNCIVVDKEGYVWIGTTSGLAVVLNPSSVLTGSKTIIRKSSLISEQPINDILIDALNNKWVATNNGVFVISSDGSSVIAQINTQNSPLLSDEVMALTSNNKNGRIYFGTKKGLIEATSLSVQPLPDYEITCYPQPFNPDKHKQLTIDGLAGDSEIRIVTASGELIRKLQSQGRITLWDGRNENGELVSNGIYLIFASSVTSNVSGVGKIAVLRK